MAKKAVLRFLPIEYRYQETYGRMPDYDADRLVKSGMTYEEAWDLIATRMNGLLAQMKYEHEHKEEIERRRFMKELDRECPF